MEKDKYSIFLQEQNRGRIDLTGFNGKPFNLSQDLGINKNRDVGDSIKNIHQETLTSRAFFSKTNPMLFKSSILASNRAICLASRSSGTGEILYCACQRLSSCLNLSYRILSCKACWSMSNNSSSA